MLPCLVLAGGIGTRMRPVTETIPKALVPVLGEPFVDLQLRWLASQGVTDVVFSIGYRGDQLREHVGDGAAHGLRVTYVDEGTRRLGTGGAVRLAVDAGAVGDAFFVLYGDSYLSVDFGAVAAAWQRSGLPAMMTVLRNHNRWGVSNAVYERGRVTRYDKRQPTDSMEWIDYGLLVLSAQAVKAHITAVSAADLADTLRDMSVAGRLGGFPARRRFHEVGSPEGVRQLERMLRGREGSTPGARVGAARV